MFCIQLNIPLTYLVDFMFLARRGYDSDIAIQ